MNAEEIPRDAGVWCPKVARLLDGLDLQCQTLTRISFSRETAHWVASPDCTDAKLRRASKPQPLKIEGNVSRSGAKEMKQVEAGYGVREEEQRQAQNIMIKTFFTWLLEQE